MTDDEMAVRVERALWEMNDEALRAEIERLNAEFRKQIQAEHVAYQELRRAAERLQAYADAHPCDHMPACQT